MRIDEGPATKNKQEPEEDEPAAYFLSWMARPIDPSDTVADAIAALPHFESLEHPAKEEDAGPGDDRRPYLPWDQGVWVGEDDGRFGENYDENYQRDKHDVDEMLKLRIVWAASGGRTYEAAIKHKYRQHVHRALGFNYKSVDDRFRRHSSRTGVPKWMAVGNDQPSETRGETVLDTRPQKLPGAQEVRRVLLPEHQRSR